MIRQENCAQAQQLCRCLNYSPFQANFPRKLPYLIIKLDSLSKNCPKGGESAKFQPHNHTNPSNGDGLYGEVTSRMMSQHYIFRAFLWLEFDWCNFWCKHFAFFLLAETDFVVFSLLTAGKWANKDGFDRFFCSRFPVTVMLLVFKSQMECNNIQSEFWLTGSLFLSLYLGADVCCKALKGFVIRV